MSQAGALDLRIPIGGLFTVLGVLVGGYGIATNGDAIYARSMSININLWWGIVMLICGALALTMGLRSSRRGRPEGAHPTAESAEGRATERREHQRGLER
jgi:hypothetical protein